MALYDEGTEILDESAETNPISLGVASEGAQRSNRFAEVSCAHSAGIGPDPAARSRAAFLANRAALAESMGTVSKEFTIDDVYQTQIASMHGAPVDPTTQGRVGRLWEIDEQYGQGSYWYFPIDGTMAVAVFDLCFNQEVSFTCQTPDLFCFGSYGRNMVPYFGITDDPGDRTLLGYAWKGQPYGQVTKENELLDVASITLLTKGLQSLSLACHCDPLVLSRAIASLDGNQNVPGLNVVFDEIRRARPTLMTAQAYYRAKITEAAALLVDWSIANIHNARQPIRSADLSALNLARAHIREHLDRMVPASELCHLTCMSASKLTRLFKQAEGITPQEYARMVRMDKACALLEETDRSMAEIAASLGFARQGSFSESFKDRLGVTPNEFRARYRGARR